MTRSIIRITKVLKQILAEHHMKIQLHLTKGFSLRESKVPCQEIPTINLLFFFCT